MLVDGFGGEERAHRFYHVWRDGGVVCVHASSYGAERVMELCLGLCAEARLRVLESPMHAVHDEERRLCVVEGIANFVRHRLERLVENGMGWRALSMGYGEARNGKEQIRGEASHGEGYGAHPL